jgi:hypothetical protein
MSRKIWTKVEDKFLRDFYFQRGVKFCSKELGRSAGSIAHRVSRLGLNRRGTSFLRAQINNGYVVIQGNYVRAFLHILLGEMKIGRKLHKGEIVHHIDGDITNNSIDNLKVMTISEHQKEHWGEDCNGRRDPRTGRFV